MSIDPSLIKIGAYAVIAVFLLLLFTRSPALQQLRVLAGGALALSLLTSFFLLALNSLIRK